MHRIYHAALHVEQQQHRLACVRVLRSDATSDMLDPTGLGGCNSRGMRTCIHHRLPWTGFSAASKICGTLSAAHW